jgi:hypothetical protein
VPHPCVFLQGLGGVVAGATLVRSRPAVVYAVVVPALPKVREGRGTHGCGGFFSLKAGPPANLPRLTRRFALPGRRLHFKETIPFFPVMKIERCHVMFGSGLMF